MPGCWEDPREAAATVAVGMTCETRGRLICVISKRKIQGNFEQDGKKKRISMALGRRLLIVSIAR